jgi:hypothetical protein
MLREIVQMGYKNRTPEVQIFSGYKPFKWGTDGNPDKVSKNLGPYRDFLKIDTIKIR